VNEVGGSRQKNAAHYIELFCALALLDFAARGGEDVRRSSPVFRTVAVAERDPCLDDLPLGPEGTRRFLGGLVALHTYLTVIRPDGQPRPDLQQALHAVTWMERLGLSGSDLKRRSGALDDLGSFFTRTWQWLGELADGTSGPAMRILAESGSPTAARIESLIAGRIDGGRVPADPLGFPFFRWWNEAAHKHAHRGFDALLQVMRAGSEAGAVALFPQRTRGAAT
jgi:hypothetical protein